MSNGSKKRGCNYNPKFIRAYILEKCEIKERDEVAQRHGNREIISKIMPSQDVPYLQDGTMIDMVFNPY